MRGLEKNCTRWRKHTDGHGDSMTNSAQWGRVDENIKQIKLYDIVCPVVSKQLVILLYVLQGTSRKAERASQSVLPLWGNWILVTQLLH